jgi:hypothetical protein
MSFAGVALLLLTSGFASAAALVSRAYESAQPIVAGSIVSLTTEKSKTVTLANTSNSDKIIGVAVGKDESLISVNAETDRVQVTTSGQVFVLVSDLNGDIKKGDKVAVSPFDGLGMKSGQGERIIGLALGDFTADSEAATTKTVTDKQGKTKQLRIARIEINVVIGNDDAASKDLNGVQKLVKLATGRTVSVVRAFVSVIIAVVAMIALLGLIYSAVYGSIISIGRNPLARDAVFRALRNVLYIAGMVVFLALVFIYLLLR